MAIMIWPVCFKPLDWAIDWTWNWWIPHKTTTTRKLPLRATCLVYPLMRRIWSCGPFDSCNPKPIRRPHPNLRRIWKNKFQRKQDWGEDRPMPPRPCGVSMNCSDDRPPWNRYVVVLCCCLTERDREKRSLSKRVCQLHSSNCLIRLFFFDAQ